MKKYYYSFFILVFVLLCTGCNGTITRNLRHNGFNVSGKFKCSNFLPKDEETPYNKMRYYLENLIIDEDGIIYEHSPNLKYSSGDYCRKASTSVRVKAIFDNRIIKGIDSKYYYLQAQNNVLAFSEVPETDNSYYLYDLLLKDPDIVKVVTADSSLGMYYVLKLDGSVYRYQISKADYNSLPVVNSISVEYSKSQYGMIEDFSYAGDSIGTFIRTEDKYFRMRANNYDKCSSYADVKCVYEMQEDLVLEEYLDKIILYNGTSLIMNYGQMFTVEK